MTEKTSQQNETETNNCTYVIVMIHKSVHTKSKTHSRGKYNAFWVEFF